MRRFFVKNLLFIIGVNVLVKPIWVFFIDRTVQNRLGHQAYGSYPQLFNLALILQIILDFGITNYNNRTVAREPHRLATLFPAMLSARMILMLLYTGLTCLAGWIIGYRGWDLVLLAGILLIQILNTLLLFIRSNISALHHFKSDGILSVADRLLMILVCGFLLIYPPTGNHFKLEWFIEVQILSYFLASVAAYIVLRRLTQVRFRFSINRVLIYSIIRDSLPYALLIFLMSIYTRTDMVMIGRLCGAAGKDQASIYTSAYRLLDMSNMFGLMFAGVLLPLFGRMLAQRDDVASIVHVSVNMLLPVSFMVAVAAVFFGNPIMHNLYKAATNYDGVVFGWLMASFPAFCIMYVYSTLLTANGSLKQLNILALAGVIINLSLNFYMITHYQALGAAITAFITQTLLAICFILFASRTIKLPPNIKWGLSHLGYLVLIVVIAYGATLIPTDWRLQLCTFGIASLLMIFAFRFISIASVKQLMSKTEKVTT